MSGYYKPRIVDHHEEEEVDELQQFYTKKKESKWSLLYTCFLIIGVSCILTFVGVLTVFLVFIEPCLNPHVSSKTYTSDFSNATTNDTISLFIQASSSIRIRMLPPGSQANRIDTFITLTSTSLEQSEKTKINLEVDDTSYFLNFTRPETFITLQHCSTEDISLSMSPEFRAKFTGDFFVKEGRIELQSLAPLSFNYFNAEVLETGFIGIGVIKSSSEVRLRTTEGPITVGATQAVSFDIYTKKGDIQFTSPSGAEYSVLTEKGDIAVTSISLINISPECRLSLSTYSGSIMISLIDILTNQNCMIILNTGDGNIEVAIKGFSGVFSIATTKGVIEVPGFPSCDGNLNCQGNVDPGGPQTHSLRVESLLGNIAVTFV